MDYVELTNHFQKNYEILRSQKETISTPNQTVTSQVYTTEYLKQLVFYQVQEGLLSKFIDLPAKLERKLQKDISFLIQEEEIKHFYEKEIRALSNVYHNNSYAEIFSVDRFYDEIFEDEILEELCNEVLNRVAASKEILNSSNELNIKGLEIVCKAEINDVKLAFSTLIKAHLIKSKLKSGKTPELPKDNANRELTRNQVVLALDKLGFLKVIEDIPHKTTKAKLISDITGYSETNIINSLNHLEKSQKGLGVNYHKDLEKVDKYLKKYGFN